MGGIVAEYYQPVMSCTQAHRTQGETKAGKLVNLSLKKVEGI